MRKLFSACALACISLCTTAQSASDSLSADTLDVILIESTRAGSNTPVAFTELTSKDITPLNNGQDVPYVLRLTPSLITTSDAGTGVGYTGMWLRGSDISRINVTINGVPLNDPESQQVFWVNTPDLLSSANNVQIQRGIGTSTNGAAAFGGSIKIDTRTLSNKPYARSSNSLGSFNTLKNNLSFGTGMLGKHFIFEGRMSQISSDGYVDRATSKLQSYFGELGYYHDRTTIKLTAFGGKEKTYQAWYGTPSSVLQNNIPAMIAYGIRNGLSTSQFNNVINSGRTYNNYEYENQTDNYTQNHAQLHLNHIINAHWQVQAALHFTHGEGYYEEFNAQDGLWRYSADSIFDNNNNYLETSDVIRQRWLNNNFYGSVFSITRQSKRWQSTLGGGANYYAGSHFGEIVSITNAAIDLKGQHYYDGTSGKSDVNVYWKNTVSIAPHVEAYIDMQGRNISYNTSGTDNDLRSYSIDKNLFFFNPKAGVTYALGQHRAFISAAHAGHEPNRNDFIDAADASAIKPEYMTDFETGYQWRSDWLHAGITGFYMQYKDQLVLTGALNDVGAPLRLNIPNSYRRGVEVEFAVQSKIGFYAQANATWSANKIEQFIETLYDYSNDGFAIINNIYANTDIAFSPRISGSAQGGYKHNWKGAKFNHSIDCAWITKYVGQQYLDNTQNDSRIIDAYLVNDVRIGYTITVAKRFELGVNAWVQNVLDNYYETNGYTYSYISGGMTTEKFYYPQATRNYLIGLSLAY